MTATASPTAITRIAQVSMTAHDIKRAVAFYRDVLKLQFLFEAPPQLAFFQCGDLRIMLAAPERGNAEQDHPGSILYYMVEDIRGAAKDLAARGAHFVGEPHRIAQMPTYDLWLAEFRDTEGNTLALMAEREKGSA